MTPEMILVPAKTLSPNSQVQEHTIMYRCRMVWL